MPEAELRELIQQQQVLEGRFSNLRGKSSSVLLSETDVQETALLKAELESTQAKCRRAEKMLLVTESAQKELLETDKKLTGIQRDHCETTRKLTDSEDTIQRMRRDFDTKIHDLASVNEDLRETSSTMQYDISDKHNEIMTLRKRNQSLRTDLERARCMCSSAEAKLQGATLKTANIEATKQQTEKELRDRLAAEQDAVSQKEVVISELKGNVAVLMSEIERLTEIEESRREQLSQEKTLRATAESQLNQLLSDRDSASQSHCSEIEAALAKSNRLSKQVTDRDEQLNILQQKIDACEDEHRVTLEDKRNLLGNIQQSSTTIRKLTEKTTEQESEIIQLTNEKTELETTVQLFKTESSKSSSEVTIAAQEIHDLMNTLSEQKKEVSQLRERNVNFQEIEAQRDNLKAELSSLLLIQQKETAVHTNQLSGITSDIRHLQTTASDWKQKFTETELKLHETQRHLFEEQQVSTKLGDDVLRASQQAEKIKHLEEELQSYKESTTRYKKESFASKKQSSEHQRIETVRYELQTAKLQYETALKECVPVIIQMAKGVRDLNVEVEMNSTNHSELVKVFYQIYVDINCAVSLPTVNQQASSMQSIRQKSRQALSNFLSEPEKLSLGVKGLPKPTKIKSEDKITLSASSAIRQLRVKNSALLKACNSLDDALLINKSNQSTADDTSSARSGVRRSSSHSMLINRRN